MEQALILQCRTIGFFTGPFTRIPMSTIPSSTAYAVHGPVAVVTLNNPPVNGLGHALRSGIVAALDQALADPQVQAIVLTGSARAFSGGGGQGAAGLFEVC